MHSPGPGLDEATSQGGTDPPLETPGGIPMNTISVTVVGNLTHDPELRWTGVSRGFRITEEPFAANPRVAVPCGRV